MQDYSFPNATTSARRDDGNTGTVNLSDGANTTAATALPPQVGFDAPRPLLARLGRSASGCWRCARVVFFLIRGFVTSMLVDRRAAPDAARGAGWAVFVFLLCTAAAVVFGLLGDYWGKFLFALPALVLMAVTGLLALVMTLRAGAARR